MEQNQDSESDEISKIEVLDIDPSTLDEVDRPPITDFEKHRLQPAKIEAVEVVLVPSKFANSESGKVHRLKIIGEIVETIKVDSDKIELRPTELINLEEDHDGNLLGLPKGEGSNWVKFKKTLKIQKPADAIGKQLPMRLVENKKTGGTFLGFMY